MLPWIDNNDIRIQHGEYLQSTVPNRCFNRLLDNDKYLYQEISNISVAPDKIVFATQQEIQSLELSSKAIKPSYIMALSATPDDIEDGTDDNRFVTVSGHMKCMSELKASISYIDVTHIGPFEPYPSAAVISALAKEVLGPYIPYANLGIDVQFRVTTGTIVRYRYTITAGTTDWIYKQRITNNYGCRLYM
jgi:hypothetical protein